MLVPKWLIKLHNNVFIEVDVIFINIMPFMVTVLRNIKFNTVQNMANKKKSTLLGQIDVILSQYRR